MLAGVRSLGHVCKYAVVGLPDMWASVIRTANHVIPVDARTFKPDEADEAWKFMNAAPLTSPTNLSSDEWDAICIVVAMAHLAVNQFGKAEIAAAVMNNGRIIALGANEVHLANDPTRGAEMVAFTHAGHLLNGPDWSGCTLLSSLHPCEMCLAVMQFAEINNAIYAAQQENVASKYFKFNDLKITDLMAASPDFVAQIG